MLSHAPSPAQMQALQDLITNFDRKDSPFNLSVLNPAKETEGDEQVSKRRKHADQFGPAAASSGGDFDGVRSTLSFLILCELTRQPGSALPR